MKEYTVRMPITGYVELTVEAEDEESAIDKVFDMATLDNVAEWDIHKEVCTGNVCHAILNKMEIYED